MKHRPSIFNNLRPLVAAIPILIVLLIRSGFWWLLGALLLFVGLRVTVWLLAPYNPAAWKAMERTSVSSRSAYDATSQIRRIPVLGFLHRLGGLSVGIPWREREVKDSNQEEAGKE